jgi:hypothetical protein
MRPGALLIGGLLAFAAASAAGGEPSLNVKVEIAEPAGLARQGSPVTSGAPLPEGFKDLGKLVLKGPDGGAVPCQFSPLGKRADGLPYWVLLDFQADLAAKGKAEFTLSDEGGNPAPKSPVKVEDAAEAITVSTGPLKFQISKTRFNLFDAVWVDGEQVVDPGELAGLSVTEGVEGLTLDSRGARPYRVAVEYAGPLRACLRVDGTYVKDKLYFLEYTCRIEAFAGRNDVRVTLKLRNSHPAWSFTALVKDATLAVKLAGGGKALPADGKGGWAAVSGEKGSVVAAYRFRAARGAAIGAADDGTVTFHPLGGAGAWLEKQDELEWQLLLRFGKGPADAAAGDKVAGELRSRLLALAPGTWYQQCDALGGPMGMLDDEIATYKAWGWKINERNIPRAGHDPNRFLNDLEVHEESETDSAADNLWQWVRTRERGFFDIGEAYAIYFRNHYMFHFDELFDPDKLVPGVELERTKFPKVQRNPEQALAMRRSRMCICHGYGEGLVDHYLLTGEVGSLEGAEDFARFMETETKAWKIGGTSPNGGRYFGRPFQSIVRLWEVTRAERWEKLMHKMGRTALEAPARDERGLIAGAAPASEWNTYARQAGGNALLKKLDPQPGPIPTKGWSSWELSIFNHAIGRYHDVTGDEDALDMCVAQAWFMEKYALEPVHKYTGYICVLDFPQKGDAYIPGMSGMPHGPGCVHDGWYTRSCPDSCVRGYRYTGRRAFLELGKTYWDRGSKMGYQQPDSSRPPDDVTGQFASSSDCKDGNLMYNRELFYVWMHPKKDTEPPEAVADLKAEAAGGGKVKLAWTAPKDDSGSAARYQVKWSELPIEDDGKYNYRQDEGKKHSWWIARNVKGEPAPGKPGKAESFTVENLAPGTCYLALRSFDAESNRSEMSNVVQVEVK